MGFSTLATLAQAQTPTASGSWFGQNSPGGSATFNETGSALQTGSTGDQSLAGMDYQQAFQAAAQALGIPLNQTRGRGQEIADYLNTHGQQNWKASAGAGDWIQDPSGAGHDYSQAGSNGFQWLDDPAGNPAGSGGYAQGGPFGAFTPPSLEEARNSPGFQYGLDETWRRLQTGAASQGTLLNGRTQEAMGKNLLNYAGLTLYPQAFNQALQTNTQNFGINQGNFGNLYNLATLGANTARNG